MIRVAIETSTSHGSVAVGRGERVLAEVSLGVQTRHAETALPALDHALRLAGIPRDAVEGVVVGSGPGSFTGVRVAGATAKGLVAALEVPFLAYPSLLALAASVPSDGPVCGLFDARRGEVYAGCWRVTSSSIEERMAPRVGAADAVARDLEPDRPLFVGEGAERYGDALAPGGRVATGAPVWPRASTLLWLAERHPELGDVADVGGWEPDYVRASSAERGIRG